MDGMKKIVKAVKSLKWYRCIHIGALQVQGTVLLVDYYGYSCGCTVCNQEGSSLHDKEGNLSGRSIYRLS